MSTTTTNQNGIIVNMISVQDNHTRMTQGQIVGIVLGWLFGAIGLYLLGLLIIFKCCKVRSPQQDSSRVSNSVQDKQIPNTKSAMKPQKHRKQMFQQNPTLQMVNVTDSNEMDSHDINLNIGGKNYYNQQYEEGNGGRMQRQETEQYIEGKSN